MARKNKRLGKKKGQEDKQGRQTLGDKTGETLNASQNDRTGRRSNRKKEKKEKKPNVGLFVTKELAIAIETTKSTVERIVKECKAKNKRFRDPDFDLEYDELRCLYGYSSGSATGGKDVQRVTEIFDHPTFFPPGGAARSAAIKQGALGSCYFLSALATVSGLPGLLEKTCVARDEEVGVYGFIFYQDQGWVSVIIDDMLYTSIPKWESLDQKSKEVYHEDKERFNALARKGGKTLVYASTGEGTETWVPLMEKAYAKLYGCFSHIEGGYTREAIEDLTGGVASCLNSRDILSIDKFWKEELSRVNHDRLFACAFQGLEPPADRFWERPTVEGLYGNHAYAVLRVAEVKGKRFVVLRNPWGQSEWTGAWSDGSKEWTPEWLKALPELNHSFGDDGQFVMEYKDFLAYFPQIDRVLLFDDSWTVASSWLQVPISPTPSAPSFGKLSYIVQIPKKSKSIFVLSQLNNRAFSSLESKVRITFEYSVVKVGDLAPLASSAPDQPFFRSGTLEIELDEGTYLVYVKLDQSRTLDTPGGGGSGPTPIIPTPIIPVDFDSDSGDGDDGDSSFDYGSVVNLPAGSGYANSDSQVISKILTSKVKALSISQNWDGIGADDFIVKPLEVIIREDLEEFTLGGPKGEDDDGFEDVDDDEDGTDEDVDEDEAPSNASQSGDKEATEGEGEKKPEDVATPSDNTLTVPGNGGDNGSDSYDGEEVNPTEWVDLLEDKGPMTVIGLRVYTQTEEPATVVGRIKHRNIIWLF